MQSRHYGARCKIRGKKNTVCGIIYRQDNSPQRFWINCSIQTSQYILSDFNINLLLAETSSFAHDFLLSSQSFTFMPTSDKPTPLYRNSLTLVDNILTNKIVVEITSGNSIFDISDHFWQFCISHAFYIKINFTKRKYRDLSCYSESRFNSEHSEELSHLAIFNAFLDVDAAFS